MPQLGIPYVLTGPDGTRAVFNDPTDTDFVGYLDPDQGITGLLDSADVREGYVDHVEGDGGVQLNSYFSRRTGTIQGFIIPDPNMLTYNQRESKLKRASRGMKAVAPSVLTWTPDGSVQRRLRLYRQGRIGLTGRRPKNFVLPMSTPDAYEYSSALASAVVTPSAVGGDQGFSSPFSNPITTTYNAAGAFVVTNQGDAETWPQAVFVGPLVNPTLRNNTTGLQWTITVALASTDTLVVDASLRTVLLNGNNAYSGYANNFLINNWWSLQPGANDIRLLNTSFGAGAQATINWRHAWE